MAANTFPEDWRDQPCFVVAIPRPLVRFVGGLLKIAEMRGFWLSESDYLRGYTAVTELEACLMSTCLSELIEQNNALYRLVNTALLGQAYTVVTEDPLVVSPAISPFVGLEVLDVDSVMGRLDRIAQLIDNTFNGTETPLYAYSPNVKEQLQSIIDSLGDTTDLATIISDLEAIALLLA